MILCKEVMIIIRNMKKTSRIECPVNVFKFLLVLCCFTLSERNSVKAVGNSDLGKNITKILNAFFSSGYDKRVRPNYGGPPVNVGVTMHIISISTVSEVQMDFTTDFYFRQYWQDPRLSFTPLPRINELYVGAEVADRIWVPDTFFANEKSAYFHVATTKNTFLRIGANGDVARSIRLTVTASCPMELQYFPMDRQLCTIEIESYGYSMADIRYNWHKGPGSVSLADTLSLPQFHVLGHRQKDKVIALSTGNYSRLICEIQFARSLGFYLIQIYIPASLIVIISWVSFWLHRNATPARVALGVTTVLTMTTLMSSTNAQLPKISYVKSIDVFLGTCFVMVFASLLEYATVGYLGKRISMRKSRVEQVAKPAEEPKKKCSIPSTSASNSVPGGSVPTEPQHQQQQLQLKQQTQLPPLQGQSQLSSQLHHHHHTINHHPPLLQQQQYHHHIHQRDREEQPPPIPPAPAGFSNPIMCPMSVTNSPRTVSVKHAHMYYPSSGTLPHRSHYERYQPTPANVVTCTPVRTCTPTHYICTHPPGEMTMHMQPQKQEIRLTNIPQDHHPSKGIPVKMSTDPNSTPLLLPRRSVATPETPSTPAPSSGPFGRCRNPNKMLGVSPSDIDKYSRVIFPVCFVCFNLMYWIIYSHISNVVEEGLVPLGS